MPSLYTQGVVVQFAPWHEVWGSGRWAGAGVHDNIHHIRSVCPSGDQNHARAMSATEAADRSYWMIMVGYGSFPEESYGFYTPTSKYFFNLRLVRSVYVL